MPRSEHGVGAKIKLNKCVVIPCGALGPMGVGRHPPSFCQICHCWIYFLGVVNPICTPPPKKKKKTAVFVAFFLGGGFQHTMAEADESILDFVIHQHDMKREVPASRIQNARSRSKEMYVVLNANQSTWI